MKKCTKCKEEKELNYFAIDRQKKDGLRPRCRECENTEYREKYDSSVELRQKIRVRVKNKKNRKKYPEHNKKRTVEYANKYPERIKAVNAVNHAIRDGKMKRGSCAICGKDGTQGHHHDYSKPLDIVWLCRSHHILLHSGRLNMEA